MTVEIRLLGQVAMCRDGREVVVTSPQAQVALARLTIERGSGTTRYSLADTLWPGGVPATWTSALRGVVSRVRAALAAVVPDGPGSLLSVGGTYRLRLPADVEVDVERAEGALAAAQRLLADGEPGPAARRARDAAALLALPFLPHHDSDWAREVRDRLGEGTVTAYETASRAALGSDPAEALVFANQAVAAAPLRESAHRCRIAAHAAAGNRAEALRAYQDLRRVLAEELGVDPSEESEAAYLGLLVTARGDPAGAGPLRGGRPLPFVGRRAELATISGRWAAAGGARGASHMVVVTGGPGAGKTRLAAEAGALIAAGGGMVLQGRAQPAPGDPCGVLVEAFDGYLGSTPADERPVLSAAARGELAAVMPSLRTPSSPRRRPTSGAAVSGALTELAQAAGRDRPLCLVLDDLAGADRHTFRCLWRLLTGGGTRLLVVATARGATGRPDAYAALVDGLVADSRLTEVGLAGLAAAEVQELVDAVLDEPRAARRAVARTLVDDTAGNPYLLSALLEARSGPAAPLPVTGPVPPRVASWVEARLAGLDEQAWALARSAAVAGQGCEVDLVVRASGLGPAAALRGLEQLIDAGLAAEVAPDAEFPTRLRFVHDVTRRVVLDGLSGIRRHRLHLALADAIEQLPPGAADRFVARLAYHRAAGSDPPDDRVSASLRDAGRAFGGRSAHQAVRLLRQAYEYAPPSDQPLRAGTLADLGLALVAVDPRDAAQTLMQAAIEARGCRRGDIAARALVGLIDAARRSGTLGGEAGALIDGLLRWSGESAVAMDPLDRARLAAAHVARGGRVPGDAPALLAQAARDLAVELERSGGFERLDERRLLAADLAAVAAATGDNRALVDAAHHQATAAGLAGDRAAVRQVLAGLGTGPAGDEPATTRMLVGYHLAVAVTEGRVTDAYALAPLAGREAGAELAVARWLEEGRLQPAGADPDAVAAPLWRAAAALAAGDRGEAHVVARALATGIEPLAPGDAWPHAVGLLAVLAVELGDATTAAAVRSLLAPFAGLDCSLGYTGHVGPVELHLARLALVTGEWSEAERQSTAALHRLTGLRALPWMGLARTALADALEGRGRLHDRDWIDELRAEAHRSAPRRSPV